MDTNQIGPATSAEEAAQFFYREAMLLFREDGNPEDVKAFLEMAQACAWVSMATNQARGR